MKSVWRALKKASPPYIWCHPAMIVNAIGNVVIPRSSEDNAVVYHLGWRKGFDHFKGQLLYTLLRPFPLEFPMLVRSIFLRPLGPTDNC